MKPLVAVVGRPNVGKSTLFNRIIGERRAIVLNTPGVTRDRNYAEALWGGRTFNVVDTGGFEPEAETGVMAAMRRQALLAIDSAEVVVFLCDGRDGLLPADLEVAEILRRAQQKVVYAVNKIDSRNQEGLGAEFWELGADELFTISAEHGRGIGRMLDQIIEMLPEDKDEDDDDDPVTRVAILGRPNAGKSTLTNKILGEERMIVDSVAGTTRDAIDTPMMHDGKEYLLIDTAGLRRKRGIKRGDSEGLSVVRTLRAMDRCHVAVVLIDANEGVTDQDAKILGMAMEKGRAIIIAVSKWDSIEKDGKTAVHFTEELRRKLPFVPWAPVIFISGLTGQRVEKLMTFVSQVRDAHRLRVATGPLNRWLEEATAKHSPPVVKQRRLRLYYATQVRTAPPTLMISCNDPEAVHFSYKRFLMNQFRESFPVEGTPIRLLFRGKKNPFVNEE